MEPGAKITNASAQVGESGIVREKPLVIDDSSASSPAQTSTTTAQDSATETIVQSDPKQVTADLSQLVNLGRIVEEVNMCGFNIKMSTLSAQENTKILERTAQFADETEGLMS